MRRLAMLMMGLAACGGQEEARSDGGPSDASSVNAPAEARPSDGGLASGLDAADCYWTVFDGGPIFCPPTSVCPGPGDACNECYCVAKPSRRVYERNCRSHECAR